ncbi:MAG TPA: zinc ribbon domain-containing protein YjdM [Bacteroidia bacterium]|nr:zinc ribbon domain-containing protein YjdM [Bacteroidia bacterium]
MNELPPCPKCQCVYTYSNGSLAVCPECFYEWDPEVKQAETAPVEDLIKDANGNLLQDGDTVVVIKDLPVKGSSKSVKAGTKVKNIRLVDGDHNISCKIEGFGAMGLKSEFVRKA